MDRIVSLIAIHLGVYLAGNKKLSWELSGTKAVSHAKPLRRRSLYMEVLSLCTSLAENKIGFTRAFVHSYITQPTLRTGDDGPTISVLPGLLWSTSMPNPTARLHRPSSGSTTRWWGYPPGKVTNRWLEHLPFSIGNTSAQSGSIFQPATLVDPRVQMPTMAF